ncbi:MAG: type II secretory pathway, component PulD, partial [Isosphaeraceae bacterium]
MGRLSTLTLILIIGAWGAAAEGASPDDAGSSPATAARKPAPVPPIRYLEAGSRLFNSGKFELAAKYLDAAQMYRDQLQQDEQTTLDAYLKELSKVQASIAAGSTATDGAAPAMTPAAVQAAPATTRVIQSGDPARGGAGDVAITPDVKQHAVWLLHEAREQMAQGNFDAAEKKIAEAEAIDVKWGLFDDTPAKVRNDLNKERPKNLASMSKPAQSLPHNRENAHALLREARAALANHQIDQAEAIAQ